MAEREWPAPLGEHAFHGPLGEYVRAVEPHTEADPSAILIQALACAGNALGRGPHFYVEATRHGTNLFVAVVGDTSQARKGTSLDRARNLVVDADPSWAQINDGEGGLSTAEGLIHAVRDASGSGDKSDPGVKDKRLLAAMGELAETLARMKRDGNPLSAMLRNAWDGKTLRVRTKSNPLEATGAHVSVIGHITQADLSRLLASADVFNGFGNRFLWVVARRSKELPFGGSLAPEVVEPMVSAVQAAITWAKKDRRIEFDADVARAWPRTYSELGQSAHGRFGAITDRAEAQVRRIALVYAALDRSRKIKPVHMRAALEVWRYCEDSADYLFGKEPPNRYETRVLSALSRRGGWTAKTVISQKVFKGKVKSYQLDSVLDALVGRALLLRREVSTRGRPRTEYRLAPEEDV